MATSGPGALVHLVPYGHSPARAVTRPRGRHRVGSGIGVADSDSADRRPFRRDPEPHAEIGSLVSLRDAGRGTGIIVEDLLQRGRLLRTLQDEKRITLAETSRRRSVGGTQQPFRCAWWQRLPGERADHLAPLDHLSKFHAASLDRPSSPGRRAALLAAQPGHDDLGQVHRVLS